MHLSCKSWECSVYICPGNLTLSGDHTPEPQCSVYPLRSVFWMRKGRGLSIFLVKQNLALWSQMAFSFLLTTLKCFLKTIVKKGKPPMDWAVYSPLDSCFLPQRIAIMEEAQFFFSCISPTILSSHQLSTTNRKEPLLLLPTLISFSKGMCAECSMVFTMQQTRKFHVKCWY